MRKLIAAMKISVDGKTQGPDGYADWVEGWSDDYALSERIDACLMGGRMYPGYEMYWTAMQRAPNQPSPATGKLPTLDELAWLKVAQRTPHYVLSTSLSTAAWPNTAILRTTDDIRELKWESGKDIYLLGGATLAASLVNEGLVDEFHFIVYPLMAGRGMSLFETIDRRRKLELMEMRELEAGRVALAYAIQ
jgi:dihydrofolate reductase